MVTMDFASALLLPFSTQTRHRRWRDRSNCLEYFVSTAEHPSSTQQVPQHLTSNRYVHINRDSEGDCDTRYQLSYDDMINICYVQHQSYLHDSVKNHIRISELYLPTPSSQNSTNTSINPNLDIVVAYMVSNNNIDYLISILAAIANFTSDTGSRDGSSHQNHGRTRYKLLPVLIPTKWTVSEIVAVLRLPSTNTSTTTTTATSSKNTATLPKQHVTILLHDAHYAAIAHQVEQRLLSSHPHQHSSYYATSPLIQHHHDDDAIHIVHCLSLPNLAHDFVMSNNNTSRSKTLTMTTGRKDNRHSHHSAHYEDIISYQHISDETAIIVFTSGTGSGVSKGVCISHRAMYVQCQMKQLACSWSDTTKLLFGTTIPIYHIGGIINYFATWNCGGTLIMPLMVSPESPVVASQFRPHQQQYQLSQSSFDPNIVFQSLSSSLHVNTLVVVPTMLHAMHIHSETQHPHRQFSHVKCILIGGQSANTSVLNFIRFAFPNAKIIQTYACTEATSSLTYHDVKTNENSTTVASATNVVRNSMSMSNNVRDDASDCVVQNIGSCVGKSPSPQIMKLLLWKDPTTENGSVSNEAAEQSPVAITTPYTPGIIVSHGPHLMNEYWTLRGRQDRSNINPSFPFPLNREFLVTNDVGYWSENQQELYYIGRRSTDTIRTGGETVWCAEVEQVLQQHQQIHECSVFGIPDHHYYGEVVCCAIGAVRGTNDMTIDQIRSFCAEKGLAGYKRPRHLLLYKQMDEDEAQTSAFQLPRNANGKVLKYRLQQKLTELLVKKKPPDRTKTAMTTYIVYVSTTSSSDDTSRVQSKL